MPEGCLALTQYYTLRWNTSRLLILGMLVQIFDIMIMLSFAWSNGIQITDDGMEHRCKIGTGFRLDK